MGTLRTLLAITVVLAHSYGFVFVGGENAVQVFYMISGFLISYVITERKGYQTLAAFYASRYIRIFPIYFTVAALTLATFLAAIIINKEAPFFKVYQQSPQEASALLVFSNVFILLQDWIMFLGVEDNTLQFSKNFKDSDVLLYQGLLVPQAWTLGVEFTFYLIAPFILKSIRVILLLLGVSIAIRLYLIHIGIGLHDPWSYRFFPAELAFFLIGALAHQIILPFYEKVLSPNKISIFSSLATQCLVFIVLTYWLIPASDNIKSIALVATFAALMPLAFLYQHTRNWDKWIGDLSYPIYICHMLVIYVSGFILTAIKVDDKIIKSVFAVVISIGFSIALNKFIGEPVESFRRRFRDQKIC